jgi:Ca2+-binding EF-hand superfamily protein
MVGLSAKLPADLCKTFRLDVTMLHDSFVRFDFDKSGFLSLDEIMLMLKENGLLPKTKTEVAEVEAILHDADEDSSGEIDFNEFLKVVSSIRKYAQEKIRDKQMRSFELYDKDHGGDLCIAEISMLLSDLCIAPKNRSEQEELAAMIHLADEDGSGTINFEEFQNLSQRIDERLKQMRYEQEIDLAMTNGISEMQMRDFRWVFDTLDVDGSDRLSSAEVLSCMSLMAKPVPMQSFETAFKQLDVDNSGELDFLEFLEFMRIMRDGEGLFSEQMLRLERHAEDLCLRVLRRSLETFRISKPFLLAMEKDDLVRMFCDYLEVDPTEDLHKSLNISTVKELYEACAVRNITMQNPQSFDGD